MSQSARSACAKDQCPAVSVPSAPREVKQKRSLPPLSLRTSGALAPSPSPEGGEGEALAFRRKQRVVSGTFLFLPHTVEPDSARLVVLKAAGQAGGLLHPILPIADIR